MGTTAEDLRRELDRERGDLTNDLQAIGDRVSPGRMVERRKIASRRRIQRVREQVMGTAHDVRERATDTTSSVTGTASGMASSATDAMREVPERAEDIVEGNPIGAGIAAFGLGLVIATLIPETNMEQRLVARVEPQLEGGAQTLGEAAQQVVEQVKPAAAEAAKQLKQEASEAASQVKDQAGNAASETADQAKEKAQEVGDRVKQ
jgi:ElaB/YqjD/DUF883 family membrane-anchored ribosome-binding protein